MIQENLNNLTSLWETAGKSMNSYEKSDEFNSSIIENSEWPNRIWLNNDATNEKLTIIKNIMDESLVKLTLPYWDIYNSRFDSLFEKHSFKLKFKQVGMSIRLAKKFQLNNSLDIKEVNSDNERKEWEKIYPLAFGYKISKETLQNTKSQIKYYLAYSDGEAIGTAIVYNTKGIAGIHGVGVIPSARRKGFADEIMKFVLNSGIDNGMKYSTLQASDMGKGIYLRLGYQEDFQIYNYIV